MEHELGKAPPLLQTLNSEATPCGFLVLAVFVTVGAARIHNESRRRRLSAPQPHAVV